MIFSKSILGAQKNRLIETVLLLEYPQHMFWLRNKKIFFCYTLVTKGLLGVCCVSDSVIIFTFWNDSHIGLDNIFLSVKLLIISYPSVLTYVLGAF